MDTVPKLRAYRWVEGVAVVTDTDMYQRTGRSHAWCGRVGYRYVVNGHTYKSRNLSSSLISDAGCNRDKEKLTARLAAYPSGKAIRIFYDPAAPERVAMVREGLKWHDYFFFLLALVPLSVGAYCITQARRVLNH